MSWMMCESYRRGTIQEAHVQGGKLTAAGRFLKAYMAASFAVLIMYYFVSPYTPWMWLVSAGLVLYVFVGNHMILGMFAPKWYPGRPLESAQGWAAIGGTAILTFGITTLRALRVW